MKISALLTTYNNEKYIQQTIDSVLNQTYKDFEFIIVNDGSTDRTKEILDNVNDKRVRIFHLEQNVGIPTALNFGIDKCQGEYVIKIDGDDLQHPERFEKQLRFMENHPEYVLSKTLFNYFPDNDEVAATPRYQHRLKYNAPFKNNTKTSKEINEYLHWFCCISHSTMMVKTEILKKYRYNNYPVFEDYDLFYRINKDGYKMGHLDECLVDIRVSEASVTAKSKAHLFNTVAYKIKEQVMENFKLYENIYIWGAGAHGQDIFCLLKDKGWKISGFIDSNLDMEGKKVKGIKVFPPKIINASKEIKVVVASTIGMFEIIKYLKSYRYETNRDFVVIR